MCLCASIVQSFLLLSIFMICLTMWMDIWVFSSCDLLQIKLLWAFVYKLLYGHMLSFFLGKCRAVGWLDSMTDTSFMFKIFFWVKEVLFLCFQSGCFKFIIIFWPYFSGLELPLFPDQSGYRFVNFSDLKNLAFVLIIFP